MSRSLSLLLPVHNAQATLHKSVSRVLDVLPDLTRKFDILIIDDGSTDATFEVATDLSLEYPQVRVIRNVRRLGVDVAIKTGVELARGDFIVAHDRPQELQSDQLVRIWHEGQQVAPRFDEAAGIRSSWIGRLLGWRDAAGQTAPGLGFRWVRRDDQAPPVVPSPVPVPAFRQPQRTAKLPSSQPRVTPTPLRSDLRHAANAPQRPNFLAEVKKFAWGE